MKLVFTKPHMNNSGQFPSFFMGNAFAGYLQYRDVWIGKEGRDFTISYNDFHKFYDISLFRIPENGDPARHIDEAIAVLQSDGTVIDHIGHTWRWVDQKQIVGKRIWVKVHDE
jgi:hypothetical protein